MKRNFFACGRPGQTVRLDVDGMKDRAVSGQHGRLSEVGSRTGETQLRII